MEVICGKKSTAKTAKAISPWVEHEPQTDERNPYPWYDLQCATCYSVIATFQIVPADKPLEPSTAVTDEPVQP